MNPNRHFVPIVSLAVLLPGAGLVVTSTGCAGPGYVSGSAVVVVDDYDYYPGDEVYYSRRYHDYYYMDGRRWVRRPTPPPSFVRGPSVHLDFHDAPEHHHSDVVRRYPKNWRPDQRHVNRQDDHRKDEHKKDEGKRDEGKRHDQP